MHSPCSEWSTRLEFVRKVRVHGAGGSVGWLVVSEGLDALPHVSSFGVSEVILNLQLALGSLDSPPQVRLSY